MAPSRPRPWYWRLVGYRMSCVLSAHDWYGAFTGLDGTRCGVAMGIILQDP